MPSPIITFKDVFHVMKDKELSRNRKQADSYLLAQGYVGWQTGGYSPGEAYTPT